MERDLGLEDKMFITQDPLLFFSTKLGRIQNIENLVIEKKKSITWRNFPLEVTLKMTFSAANNCQQLLGWALASHHRDPVLHCWHTH